jgi:hypothetical protein
VVAVGFVMVVEGRETAAEDLLTLEPLVADEVEVFDFTVDVGLEVDVDLVVLEPPLLVCAKASDWNAVSANPSSATAIVVLIVFIIKKF